MVAKLATTFDKVVARGVKVVARNITINEEKPINHTHSGLHSSFFSLILTILRSITCLWFFHFFANKWLEKVVASLATTSEKVVANF